MAFFKRAGGILLHPTALPGPHGIGTLGTMAFSFLNWMEEAGQSYWQICPLAPTGYGDSPYQGFSAFAGNPNLIDLEELMSLGLLNKTDLDQLQDLPDDYVNFGRLIPLKNAALQQAWKRYSSGYRAEGMEEGFNDFRVEAAPWLEDFCLFMVLKTRHNGQSWDEWEAPYRFRESAALSEILALSEDELEYHSFVQYLFYRQWSELKSKANQKGINIIGDLPIFIAFDSSDCWANPELFQLDKSRHPINFAGVPPDYFSASGQLWGNPLYDWERMEKNGFSWWISILKSKLEQFDALRIDHFRGFSAYWSVPYGENTAINGQWIPAPGSKLFSKVREVLGDLPIIAEDLGVITEDVVELIHECGLPGMKVLQFAFDSSEENDYLPHNYEKNCIVYTGTHDNDTSAGWFSTAAEHDRETALSYLNLPPSAESGAVTAAMVRTAIASAANLAIIPVQDILELGSEARFNTPGTLGGNWIWRADEESFNSETAARLMKLTRVYGRLKSKK